MRCLHESSLYDSNCFITLTYDDDHLPLGGNLIYPDFQKFMKRLRKRFGSNIRFYCGGEYGETTYRPHFHACLFNFDFPDKVYFKRSSAFGDKLYTSKILEELWPFGMSSVGDVSFHSAAYIARYCVQKVTGDAALAHYRVVTPDGEIIDRNPEFNHMSLKPGIGSAWLAKYKTDVYPHDYVIINGVKVKPPKYYDKLFGRDSPDIMSSIKEAREYDGYLLRSDNTDSRLIVKEAVQKARLSFLKREI